MTKFLELAPDERRAHVRRMWASVAPGWQVHHDFINRRAAEVTRWMVDAAAPKEGERVIELACSSGEPGLEAARRMHGTGEVVITDLVSDMTAIAAQRANAAGLTNVVIRERDLEAIDEPDDSFDVALCRDGLMLVVDPSTAAREIARVLRPGGRFTTVVWGPRELNPWLGLVFDAIGGVLDAPMPPPGVPGPFSLSDASRLESILNEAGFADVEVVAHPVPLVAPSFEDWWTRTLALAGPIATVLKDAFAARGDEIRERARNLASPYADGDGSLRFAGLALLAKGMAR